MRHWPCSTIDLAAALSGQRTWQLVSRPSCRSSSTFASDGTAARAKLAKLAPKAHIFNTGAPDLGADGKDYRANSVHAPFPGNLSTPSAPCGLKARTFQAAASRLFVTQEVPS